ncbi:conserved hypothetical protein [Trichinella spiralis]|uniref:hypothetical protein n=1 Tax=Trichinella spiralis TaxID=6334 RepID=UPI0001EFBF84|nr:conserved hypothetical protein [Trichinella spiralis]
MLFHFKGPSLIIVVVDRVSSVSELGHGGRLTNVQSSEYPISVRFHGYLTAQIRLRTRRTSDRLLMGVITGHAQRIRSAVVVLVTRTTVILAAGAIAHANRVDGRHGEQILLPNRMHWSCGRSPSGGRHVHVHGNRPSLQALDAIEPT